jgi:ribonuclease BN (tRNA processing enzyme)
LIHDAQYTDEHYLGLTPGMAVTQGYGHSTVSIACHAALTAGVKKLVLFHHAPEYDDRQMDEVAAQARAAFPQVVVASEGMEIKVETCQVTERLEEGKNERVCV